MVQYHIVIVLTTASTFQSHTKSPSKKTKHPETRENAGEQVVICFRFESDWLKEWCNFSGPITE